MNEWDKWRQEHEKKEAAKIPPPAPASKKERAEIPHRPLTEEELYKLKKLCKVSTGGNGMDYSPYIKVAIEAMTLEIKSLNVDANLHEIYGAEFSAAIKASKRRSELRKAITVMEALLLATSASLTSPSSTVAEKTVDIGCIK
jgi:hypothetical protein